MVVGKTSYLGFHFASWTCPVFVCLHMLTVFIFVLGNGPVSKMDQEQIQMRKQRR